MEASNEVSALKYVRRARWALKIMLGRQYTCPLSCPQKPTRNGPGTKEPLPTMQKEGTRNTQERFIFIPHSKERSHQSGHRAMFFGTIAHKDLLSCFWCLASWQGKCIHYGLISLGAHAHGENWFATPNMGSIFGPIICSLPYCGLVLGAADWSAKRASPQLSFFVPPFAPSFGVQFGQHGRSCNDSLCARPASPPKGLLAESFLAQS